MVLKHAHLLLLLVLYTELLVHHRVLFLELVDLLLRSLPLDFIVVIRNGQRLIWKSRTVNGFKVQISFLTKFSGSQALCLAVGASVSDCHGAGRSHVGVCREILKLVAVKMEPFGNWI